MPRHPEIIGYATTDFASTPSPRAGSGEGPATWRPALEAGTVLASRYRIVSFLARGGMGEVYEAEDLTLKMRVALKSIAPEVSADAKMIDRLKREVLLARKVTHPNVCRLHDLGYHHDEHGTFAFLTMDLLRGIPLAVHLARKGHLEAAEALPILRQIAAGLDAAHDAGVIHRDLKTRNVMLVDSDASVAERAARSADTPSRSGAARAVSGDLPRAMVMDFGIAVASEEEERRILDTGEGRFLGTPAYMAPEQVSGAPVTTATDIYSLGVMLFELVTGDLPFHAPSALETITMRLTHDPPAPRSLAPGLDRRWNDAILRCLARDPSARFARAGDIVAAVTASPRVWTVRRPVLAGALVASLAALGAVAAVATTHGWKRAPAVAAAPLSPKRRPTVGIFAFRNLAARADAEWLSTALGDMLATELAADEQLRLLPGERVARAQRELSIERESSFAPGTLARIHDNLGADYAVTGGYVVIGEGPTVRVDLALQDARTGATLTRVAASGDEAKLFDIVTTVGTAMRKKLGVRAPSSDEAAQARAALPDDPEAARFFAEGQARGRASDFGGALAAFEKAVAADPTFPLSHAGLAGAASALGYDPRAQEESKKAFELSRGLSREEQLVVESRYRGIAKEWTRAVEIDHTLFEFFPDNVEYGLHYVHSLVAAGRAKESFAVIDAMRALPPPECDDPRIDVYEAVAASKISDFKRQLAAGRAAVAKAARFGPGIVLGDAHHHVAEALGRIGSLDESMAEYEAARAIFAVVGDRDGEAGELAGIAQVYGARGEPVRALPLQERALEIEREIGARYKIANRVNEIGMTLFSLGEARKALARFVEARGLYEAISDREGVGNAIANAAMALEEQGELAAARKSHLDAAVLLRAVDARNSLMDEAFALGELELQRGALDEARRLAKDGEAQNKEMGSDYYAARSAMLRAALAREAGDAAASRGDAEAARAGFRAVQARGEEWESEAFLARLALDEGRAADAEGLARGAAEAAHAASMRGTEATALAVLAAALVSERKLDEATATLDRATALGADRMSAHLELELARAALLASSAAPGGDGRERASSALAEARKRAEQSGFALHVLDLRLAAARLHAGAAGARELAAVAADARAAGVLRVARAAAR